MEKTLYYILKGNIQDNILSEFFDKTKLELKRRKILFK